MSELMWVYHKTNLPKIIKLTEWKTLSADGWSDTPATFINLDELGIDSENPLLVDEFGKAVADVVDEINSEINSLPDFDSMPKDALITWSHEMLDIEFPKTININTLRKKVKLYATEMNISHVSD